MSIRSRTRLEKIKSKVCKSSWSDVIFPEQRWSGLAVTSYIPPRESKEAQKHQHITLLLWCHQKTSYPSVCCSSLFHWSDASDGCTLHIAHRAPLWLIMEVSQCFSQGLWGYLVDDACWMMLPLWKVLLKTAVMLLHLGNNPKWLCTGIRKGKTQAWQFRYLFSC